MKTNDMALYNEEYYKPHGHFYNPIKFLTYAAYICYFNPKTVLDVGCGTNKLCKYLRMLGVDAVGLDFSPDSGADVQGSATDLPFEDNSFDIVCSFDVLEHLPYDGVPKAMAEMTRVCKHRQIHHVCMGEDGGDWNDPYHIAQEDRRWWFNEFSKHQQYVEVEHHAYVHTMGVSPDFVLLGNMATHLWIMYAQDGKNQCK